MSAELDEAIFKAEEARDSARAEAMRQGEAAALRMIELGLDAEDTVATVTAEFPDIEALAFRVGECEWQIYALRKLRGQSKQTIIAGIAAIRDFLSEVEPS